MSEAKKVLNALNDIVQVIENHGLDFDNRLEVFECLKTIYCFNTPEASIEWYARLGAKKALEEVALKAKQ